MSELYDSVDYNNLKFDDVGPTKDASFYMNTQILKSFLMQWEVAELNLVRHWINKLSS